MRAAPPQDRAQRLEAIPTRRSVILAAPASGAGVQARAARPALTWPQSLNPQR